MKTRNNNQKTENRSFRKMVLRAGVVVFSIVLISLTTTSAQEIWEQFLNPASYGKMIVADSGNANEFEKADAAIEAIYSELTAKSNFIAETFICEDETEEALEIESWMTNEIYLNTNALTITDEADEALNLEDWMMTNSNFRNNMFVITDETEAGLEIESWMLNTDSFNSTGLQSDLDVDLKIESWMTDSDYFRNDIELANKPMEPEAWMTDEDLWGF